METDYIQTTALVQYFCQLQFVGSDIIPHTLQILNEGYMLKQCNEKIPMRRGYEWSGGGRTFTLLAVNYKHCNRKIRQNLLFITELVVNKFVTYVSLAGSRRGGNYSRSETGFYSSCSTLRWVGRRKQMHLLQARACAEAVYLQGVQVHHQALSCVGPLLQQGTLQSRLIRRATLNNTQ